MEQKTQQIKKLISYLINKYGSANIVVTDYWDADNTAIGIADKTKEYTVYISGNGRTENRFYVSLENPTTTNNFPYTPAGDFYNLSAEEVEEIVIEHLKIIK